MQLLIKFSKIHRRTDISVFNKKLVYNAPATLLHLYFTSWIRYYKSQHEKNNLQEKT